MAEPEVPTAPAVATSTQPQLRRSPRVRLVAERCLPRSAQAASSLSYKPRGFSPSTGDAAGQTSGPARGFYNSAQWTADGTSILAGSSEQTVSVFVLPDDLLESDQERQLNPQSITLLPEPTQAVAAAPYFSLAEPTSQIFLVGCRDHPIQLYHAFPNGSEAPPICSYKLIRRETEEYIKPASLIWTHPGTHFICGSANRIDYLDMSRYGSDSPLLTISTIPSKRHKSKGGGVGMKGTVSALAEPPPDTNGESILAAGTWTRWIGLYDIHRTEKTIANWSISNPGNGGDGEELGGQGIIQLLWSPCGRYLIVNERQSEGILVYDIRGAGKLLSVLKGRSATTQQKLTCDIFQGDMYSSSSFEVWGGCQNGSVVVWEEVGAREGSASPSWDWDAHESPIGSTAIHSSGSVVATCSGGWRHSSDQEIDGIHPSPGHMVSSLTVLPESSLKIWSIEAPRDEEER